MSNYIKSTDFATKDSLTTGDPSKIIKGTEINTEFNNIATAITTKAENNSPAFTGNPSAPTQTAGNNSTRLATTAFVSTAVSNATNALGTLSTQDADDVAITGGAIIGITDLAVADGGTGVSTLAVNAVVLGNGTSAVQTVAPSTSGNVLTSNGTTWQSTVNPTIGVNQTWQDVSGSRAEGTTYTNNTGKPIMVSYGFNSTNGFNRFTAYVGSVIVGVHQEVTPASTAGGGSVSFIVPDSATYSIVASGTYSRAFWSELR